jgi:hypothetical protein
MVSIDEKVKKANVKGIFNNYEARQGLRTMHQKYSSIRFNDLLHEFNKNKFAEFYLIAGRIVEKDNPALALKAYNKAFDSATPVSGALFEVSNRTREDYVSEVRNIAKNRIYRVINKDSL